MGSKPLTLLAVPLVVALAVSTACAQDQRSSPKQADSDKETTQQEAMAQATTVVVTDEGTKDWVAGAPPPPEYEVKKDGRLIIGGGVFAKCADVGEYEPPTSFSNTAKEQAQASQSAQAMACTEAGFPPDEARRTKDQ